MDHAERHRIATCINTGLQRHFQAGIDVAAMLAHPGYAREVVFVCQGLNDTELKDLAAEFERVSVGQPRPMPRIATADIPELTQAAPAAPAARQQADWGSVAREPAAPAPQDAAWSRDTSGFGVTRGAEWGSEDSPQRGSRLRLGSWFRRETRR